jgi:pimeloyl-ACP methyl ester carboxylesterase
MSTPPERWWGRPLAESRWPLELARLSVDPVMLGRDVARGDGRPVVLMPGFLAGDQTLLVLAAWLRRMGHRPYTCGFVASVDCSDRALDRVERRVEQLHGRHGRRVALVGHSRGGHYARALASRRPDRVSHAVSLGADLQGMLGVSAPTQAVVAAARRGIAALRRARAEGCLTPECACGFARDFAAPLRADRVRFTSVYSKSDGVVRWRSCLDPAAKHVEVHASHCGMAVNPGAYRAMATALDRFRRRERKRAAAGIVPMPSVRAA